MKNKLLVGASVTLIVMLLLSISASTLPFFASNADTGEGDEEMRTVTVSGSGEIVVAPDLAYIDLGVQTKNPDAALAQSENADLMTKVINAIKAAGIDEKDIKTTGYSLYQTYDYGIEGERSDPYYVANNIVNVKIRDVDAVGEIIDIASKAGSNSINSIRFALEDDSVYYQEALKLAMESAKGKATAIMDTFDKVPGIPSSVSESSGGGNLYYDYYPAKAAMEASTPIESGEITISASVSVTYDY